MGASASRSSDSPILIPPEVAYYGLIDLDVALLKNIAKLDPQFRLAVKDVLRHRITALLAPFIPDSQVGQFLSTLTSTQSVVGGSIAQAVLTPRIFDKVNPTNLDIFARKGFTSAWTTFLSNLGYNFVVTVPSVGAYVETVTVVTKNRTNSTLSVKICEARGPRSVPPILGSPLTSQMNFFTEYNIYCIVPALTLQMKTMRTTATAELPSKEELIGRGLKEIEEKEERKLCESKTLCRALVRSLGVSLLRRPRYPADEVMVLSWDVGNQVETFLSQGVLSFSIGGLCVNSECTFTAARRSTTF